MKPVNLHGPKSPDKVEFQTTLTARNKLSTSSATTAANSSDRIDVSNRGEEIRSLVSRANQVSTFREDLVESLRLLIASGRYDVPSEEITSAILKDESIS
ncbi:MAG TPA: flagellar biosynthesis anti-sigma factor FlgM [Pyrinomonadaceae bacterium]|nr:flagellar biosynthesis anti-sigma factor FlgM [Pyrinomonadaceae bacterium]